VVASELTSARRQGLGQRDMWQRRSSPQQVGEVRSRGTHGSTGAYIVEEAMSRAEGHVTPPELTLTKR
jgi:hypothetical protein